MAETNAGGASPPALQPKQQKPGAVYLRAPSKLASKLTGRQMGTGTIVRKGPVDVRSTLLKNPAAQDLAAASGAKRPLNTNLTDHGPQINTNGLRFARKQDFSAAMVQDGGASYTPSVCCGNWVEDRADKTYKSGFHARELGFVKIYQSENNASFRPPSAGYYQKVYSRNPLAKPPAARSAGSRTANVSDGSHLYYAKSGFGDGPGMDHTAPASRGGYWVGTAAVRSMESMATTANKREPFEFQKRNSCFDVNAKMLDGLGKPLDMTDRHMARTVKHLNDGQRWASTWTTTSRTAFQDFSRVAVQNA